jgi:hypothetical protein
MAAFNKPHTSRIAERADAVQNMEGDLAFSLNPYTRLMQMVFTCMYGTKKFYEKPDESEKALLTAIEEVAKIDPKFLLQLAVYTREKMYLRSVSQVLAVEYANLAPGQVPRASAYINRVIGRVDDMTEMVALQFMRNEFKPRESKLPMVLKRSINEIFESDRFDEYQLSKYDRDGVVKLKDLVCLTNPKPKNHIQNELFKRVLNRTLKTAETHEVMRSTGKMTWRETFYKIFLKGGRVNNYMALIKNLRNIITSDEFTDTDVTALCNAITDEKAILQSKLFPFRFLVAHRELQKCRSVLGINRVLDSLSQAMIIASANVPRLAGRTLIVGDVSGSMRGTKISALSDLDRMQVAVLLGVLAGGFCDKSDLVLFATQLAHINVPSRPDPLGLADELAREAHRLGGSTEAGYVVQYLQDDPHNYDRVIMFTDEEFWSWGIETGMFQKMFAEYRRRAPNCKLYLVNLVGYGSSAMPDKYPHTYQLAGWSDGMFKMINAIEGGSGAIEEIKKVEV